MDTLVKYAKYKPSQLSFKKIRSRIIDAGHLEIYDSILNNFLFYKDGRKRNILQIGKPGTDLETVGRYLNIIFHCFVYFGDDTTFQSRLMMPDYQHQIVLLDETAKPEFLESPDLTNIFKMLTGQGFEAKSN